MGVGTSSGVWILLKQGASSFQSINMLILPSVFGGSSMGSDSWC